jgi:aspartate/methionine/tyrosine aminotransferase
VEKKVTINTFKLEDYLTNYEFSAAYLLCCSDAESFGMHEIMGLADPADRALWDNLRLGYTEVKGLPILREQIALSLYPSLSAAQISCFAGAEEGIFCALFALCEPSDHVIVLTPCYQSFVEIPKIKKARLSLVPLRLENNWRIDLADIKQAIRPNTKCVVINFPHNPTGQVITQHELEDLVKLCDAHGIWLLSDEVYRLLGEPCEAWAKPAAEIYPKALSLGVMSKAFGMAGLRLGWIASQDINILQKMEQVKHYTSICNSAPTEIISLIALKNKNKILARNNQIVADNLALIDEFFQEHSNLFSWARPQGGCVGFVDYKGQESIDTFCERLVKHRGVLLLPASIYDHPSNCFRIGFGRKNMPAALSQLGEFIRS